MKKQINIFFLLLTMVIAGNAQNSPIGGDLVLAGEIESFSLSQAKIIKQQNEALGVEGVNLGALEVVVNSNTELHKAWNDYLSSFHLVVTIAAQTYGFYQEIDKLLSNFRDLSAVIESAPSNMLAVALKKDRSRFYGEIIAESTDIVNDITKLCFGDGENEASKMTEKERIELVFGIRPKLKAMNYKLKRLALAIKYTSLTDVWRDIQYEAKPTKTKADIAKRSLQRWSDAAKGGVVVKQEEPINSRN